MCSRKDPSGFVTVSTSPDIRLFYTVTPDLESTLSKPVILLSNPLSASSSLWDAFVDEFSSTYAIIRYDARFHGQSPLPADDKFDYATSHTLKDLADDVTKLLDALGLDETRPVQAFIGLSIGAGIGVILAAQHPERFKNFIIVGTKAYTRPEDNPAYDARIKFARVSGMLAQGRQSVERWFNKTWITANSQQAESISRMVGSQDIRGFIANVSALRDLDLWTDVKAIQGLETGSKLLFVAGEHDSPAVVEDTKKLAKEAGSQVTIIEGAGHIVNVQNPDKFHDVVRTWLEESI